MKKTASRPHVAAHFAMTADGKISTRALTPSQFTSSADKTRLQEVRAKSDAVLVGRGTLEADTMSLGLSRTDLREVRVSKGLPPVPLRVVITNSGRLDPEGKVFRYPAAAPIIFSTRRMPLRLRADVARKAELFLFDGKEVDLRVALEILHAEFAVRRLVCEGGGTLLRSLAARDLVDSIFLTVAPVLFGGSRAPTLTGIPGQIFNVPRDFRIVRQRVVEGECVLELQRVRAGEVTPDLAGRRPRKVRASGQGAP